MANRNIRPSLSDVARGALAGALGGIVGTWAMATTNSIWNRTESAIAPTDGHGRRGQREAHAGVGTGRHAQSEPRSHHAPGPMPSERLVEIIARKVSSRPLTPQTREALGSVVHYLFGAAAGAVYGGLAARFPKVTIGHGTAYGAAVLLAADEIGIPALGIGPAPDQSPLHAHAYALAGHLGYALALETVRRVVDRGVGGFA
jgi:hypothetical protein